MTSQSAPKNMSLEDTVPADSSVCVSQQVLEYLAAVAQETMKPKYAKKFVALLEGKKVKKGITKIITKGMEAEKPPSKGKKSRKPRDPEAPKPALSS